MSAPDPRPRHRSRRGLALAAGLVAIVVLGFAGVLVAVGSGAGSDESDLPTLPPIEQRESGVFDDEGCLRVEGECTIQADELDAVAAGAPGDQFRTLEGFTGPRYTTDLARDVVLVLEDTVAEGADADGTWTASGLVRNETAEPVGVVEVTARQLDSAGTEVATATATVLVAPLRPGEPAPFVVESVAPADQVTSVEWSVYVEPAGAGEASRATELTTYWTEVAGDRELVSVNGYTDPAGDKPHLVFGSLTGLPGADVDGPTVVAAWYGADGRVLHTTEVDVVSLADFEPLDTLDEGMLGDFLVVVDGPVAPSLASAELGLWAVAS